MRLESIVLLGTTLLALGGCTAGERPQLLRPRALRTARDAYAATRSDPAALRAWNDASRRALRSGLKIAPSFRERVRFPVSEDHAVAYRFTLVRGQSLSVRIDAVDGAGTPFVDVFHHVGGDIFRPTQTADPSARGLTLVATVDGEYVLRIQPKMGAGGMYDVTVRGTGSLLFPVAGGDLSDVGGVFGDPRDDGARAHEGVDIFAYRGTPVLAAADGFIRQARNTPTGGLVIWQSDAARDLTYYYAHLDELIAREGAYVDAGDTIGTVGNTGNARGARPHLHFAVYRPGTIPIDPAPLLAPTVELEDVPIRGSMLGAVMYAGGAGVRLRSSPSPAGSVITELSPATPLFVLGDTGTWQRVVLPNRTTGFVAAHLTTPADSDGAH